MFTRLGRIIASLILFLGVVRVALGIWIASMPSESDRMIAAGRYLGKSSGEAIDQASIWILAAIALGILVEISKKLDAPQN